MRNTLFVKVLFLSVFTCGPAFGQGAAPRPEAEAVSAQTADGKTLVAQSPGAAPSSVDNSPVKLEVISVTASKRLTTRRAYRPKL